MRVDLFDCEHGCLLSFVCCCVLVMCSLERVCVMIVRVFACVSDVLCFSLFIRFRCCLCLWLLVCMHVYLHV